MEDQKIDKIIDELLRKTLKEKEVIRIERK